MKYFSFEMPDHLPEGLVHNVDVSTRPEPVAAAPFARLALQSHLSPGSTEYTEFSYLAGMSPYISLKIKKRHYEYHMIETHIQLST
jgi:hypothetical protein